MGGLAVVDMNGTTSGGHEWWTPVVDMNGGHQ